jgi:hypothetical protein
MQFLSQNTLKNFSFVTPENLALLDFPGTVCNNLGVGLFKVFLSPTVITTLRVKHHKESGEHVCICSPSDLGG